MRLINVESLKLEECTGQPPKYAILSHTWEGSEVTLQDWQIQSKEARSKEGYRKIVRSCKQAQVDGFKYLWCDTNCIDKTSSAELTEAINSMFSWYKNSEVCYAYLADVPRINPRDSDPLRKFRSSRWFTRGWTLQELLAPTKLTFFAQDWTVVGTRDQLSNQISAVTRIKEKYMGSGLHTASVGERMSWLSGRETTRLEDIAYCMFGIFDINMPLLYGEREKAFIRLQEEIIRVSNDQTIFCWTWDDRYVPQDWASILSPSPKTFATAGKYSKSPWVYKSVPYTITNAGLSIKLPVMNLIHERSEKLLAVLNVRSNSTNQQVALLFDKLSGNDLFGRCRIPSGPVPILSNPNVLERSMYLAGSRDRYVGQDTIRKPANFAVILTVDSGEIPPESIIATQPRLNSGVLSLLPCSSNTHFGRFLTLETLGGVNSRDDKVGGKMICRIFFGVRVQDKKIEWCTKLTGIDIIFPDSTRVDFDERQVWKQVSNDKSFWRSHFSSDRDPMSDTVRLSSIDLVASVNLNPSVTVAENSKLAVAQLQIAHLIQSANVAPWDRRG